MPTVGVLLLDVVLGYGACADPAGAVVEAIEQVRAKRAAPLVVIATLTGTDADPQGRSGQAENFARPGLRWWKRWKKPSCSPSVLHAIRSAAYRKHIARFLMACRSSTPGCAASRWICKAAVRRLCIISGRPLPVATSVSPVYSNSYIKFRGTDMYSSIAQANEAIIERIKAARPHWVAVRPAKDAVVN